MVTAIRVSPAADGWADAEAAATVSRAYADGLAWTRLSCVERVTGIEPALSAWELRRPGLLYGLTCGERSSTRHGQQG